MYIYNNIFFKMKQKNKKREREKASAKLGAKHP